MKCKRSVTVPQKERMSERINKALELRLGKNGARNPFLIFLMNLVEITHYFIQQMFMQSSLTESTAYPGL